MTIPLYVQSARQKLYGLLADGNTVANYRAGIGQTNDGAGLCSAWANQIGAAGSLTASGIGRPTIQADGSLLFDGTGNFMQATFTLAQPISIYGVGSQITWSSGDKWWDGVTADSMLLFQTGAGSPELRLFAGTGQACSNADLAINTKGVVTAIYNGASSALTINRGTPSTGNPGATGGGGMSLAVRGDTVTGFGNIQVWELIIRNVADSATTQALIQSYLKAIYGTP